MVMELIGINKNLFVILIILMMFTCLSSVYADNPLSASSNGGSGSFSSEDSLGDGDGSFTSNDEDVTPPNDDDYDDDGNDESFEDENSENKSYSVSLRKYATGYPLILLFISMTAIFFFKR